MSLSSQTSARQQRALERALTALDQGDTLGAIDSLEDLMRRYPTAEVALHLALAYTEQGLENRAIETYEICLGLDPRSETALANLALLLEQQGRFDPAIKLYERLLSISPNNQVGLKGAVFLYYRQANYPAAQNQLNHLLSLDPKSPWAMEQQGLLFYAQGKTEEAIESHSNALAVDNTNGSVWNNLGNSHIKNLQVREAENAYRQAIRSDESNPDYWYNLGELLFHYASKAEAIDPLLKAVELAPSDQEAWNYLAQAQAEARPSEAERSFSKLIQLAGESVENLGALAKLYAFTGEKDKEVETRGRLAKLNPYDMENNFAIAQVRLTQGQPDIAYKLLQDCLTISEKEYETWFRLAQSFQLEQKLEEEFNCLEKVIKANPAHHAAWTRLGHVALKQDLPLKAYKYFIKAAPALKNDHSLWKVLMERLTEIGAVKEALDACDQVFELAAYSLHIWDEFYRHFKKENQEKPFLNWLETRLFKQVYDAQYVLPFATLLARFGRVDLAQKLYDHLLKQYPQFIEIHYQYAQFLSAQNKHNQARELCTLGLTIHPQDYQLTLALGDSYYWEGDYPKAELQYYKALQQRRDDWRVWFSLGNIAARSRKFEEAIQSFSHSIEIYNLEAKSYYNRGLAYRKRGKSKAAERDFRASLAINRKQAPAWSALGSLAREATDYKKARCYYRRALASNRSYKIAWTNLGLVYTQLDQPEQASHCADQASKLETSTGTRGFTDSQK